MMIAMIGRKLRHPKNNWTVSKVAILLFYFFALTKAQQQTTTATTTTKGGEPSSWITITYDNFSDGWGNYESIFGSGNTQWVSSSLKIQDDAGDESSIFLSSFQDVSLYEDLRVRFWYYADSMAANLDSFVLEYLDDPAAANWIKVKQFVAGSSGDFVNHQHKHTVVTFSQELGTTTSLSLTKAVKIRFRCQATNHDDRIYLDEIRFEGLLQQGTAGMIIDSGSNDDSAQEHWFPPQRPVPSNSPSTSSIPSILPSASPSLMPSLYPSILPSALPSSMPSMYPSQTPSQLPSKSVVPSSMPSRLPSSCPSLSPSTSASPSAAPSLAPSFRPSHSLEPSHYPSTSLMPSREPSSNPSSSPSFLPSLTPSYSPSTSSVPSLHPTLAPSYHPSLSGKPSGMPTISGMPSTKPSGWPSGSPSLMPSTMPSNVPSAIPSTVPSSNPSTFHDGICPRNRRYPPEKFSITPYPDNDSSDSVEDDLNEISYVAYSDQMDSNGHRYAYMASDKEQYSLKVLQFTHNIFDSGNHFHGHGNTVATYTLFVQEPTNDDWEDISLGPCTDVDTLHYTTDQVCICVGNIGNNVRSNRDQRKELFVYKFVEPTIGANGPVEQNVSFVTIGYEYGDGFDQSPNKYYDAEAMFVDWVGVDGSATENAGDIYIVTKSDCSGGVGKIPVSEHRDLEPGGMSSSSSTTSYSMPKVVDDPPLQGDITCNDGPYRVWSGADMARNGQLITMIREGPPSSVYFFSRHVDDHQSVADALRMSPCNYMASISVGLDHEKKYEAVGFVDPEGLRFAAISECQGSCTPTLYQFELEYPDSNFPVIQGPLEGWETLSHDIFEDNGSSSWGNWVSGGGYAALSNEVDTQGSDNCNGNCACEGDWAVRLKDDKGIPSSVSHSASYYCDDFSLLRITFQFKFRAFDHLDTLFLEISLDGGATYFIVGDWAHSVPALPGYTNPLLGAVCYDGRVTLCPADFRVTGFGNNVKLRFRNSGNGSNDRVYVDNILFEGHVGESKIA